MTRSRWIDRTLAATALAALAACVDPDVPDLESEAEALVLPVTDGPAEVRAGTLHTCVRQAFGGVSCWGRADRGQAGDGITPAPARHLMPETAVTTSAPWLASGTWLAAGADRACVRTRDHEAMCWGASSGGWPGGASGPAPALVTGLGNVDEIILPKHAFAYTHPDTACVRDGGTIRCWGGNQSGLLGLGGRDSTAHPIPHTIPNLGSDVAQLVLGEAHACARFGNGTATCWGENGHGELGNGTTASSYAVGAPIAGLTGVVQLAAGIHHTCALTADGIIRCWGLGGLVGDGSNTTRLSPTAIEQDLAAKEIVAGQSHTCARFEGDRVECWGQNWLGQLGTGDLIPSTVPRPVALPAARQLTAGVQHSCALTRAGEVYCWGDNEDGQLGDGSTVNRSAPVAVVGL